MNMQSQTGHETPPNHDSEVRNLYRNLLDQWGEQNASGFANLFAEEGNVVGFDGSIMNGRAEIESQLSAIFANNRTAAYIGKVRSVRFITPDVAVLSAVAGMVPLGQTDLSPDVNTIQTLVASRHNGRWLIEAYQNTPAAFHGRPEAVQSLTNELRQELHRG
jgi:uncharacterized protein (TIGR02246 family)